MVIYVKDFRYSDSVFNASFISETTSLLFIEEFAISFDNFTRYIISLFICFLLHPHLLRYFFLCMYCLCSCLGVINFIVSFSQIFTTTVCTTITIHHFHLAINTQITTIATPTIVDIHNGVSTHTHAQSITLHNLSVINTTCNNPTNPIPLLLLLFLSLII